MTYFVLTLGENHWADYESRLRGTLNDQLTAPNRKEELWHKYQKMHALQGNLHQGFQKYSKGLVNYHRVFGWRFGPGSYPYQQFLKNTGGIPPDLDEEGFYEHNHAGAEYLKFLRHPIYRLHDMNPEFNKLIPNGNEIPPDLTHEQFNSYIESKVSNLKSTVIPDAKTIQATEDSDNNLGILIIPPLSITISVISIFLNILLLFISCLPIRARDMAIANCYGVAVFAGLMFLMSQTYPFSYNKVWDTAERHTSMEYPLYASFWRLAFNLEHLICLWDSPLLPTLVTDRFYDSPAVNQ